MNRFQTEDGAWLAFHDEGEGLPVLALAGLTRDHRDFEYLTHHLPPGIRFISLDSRGRGQSDWTGAQSYTVLQESADVIALLDHLQLDKAAILGSSRGGLIGMLLALTHKQRLSGVCLNDAGPVLERAGLERIGHYIGMTPAVTTLQEIADRMPATMPGFAQVSDMRWAEETIRHFVQLDGSVGLPYDPELKEAFDTAMSAPAADAWPLFDACEGLPLALIHGRNSDVLSSDAVDLMRSRRPDMLFADVPDRGHIPFLDEPEALACITAWLQQIRDLPANSDTSSRTASGQEPD